ncbi:pyridoxal phosphate-dependent aminotransferase [Desulfobacca acetoxidans]|uniref:Aminotransferase n=1 Tax=Desulfobacca acetoxidans (strain ATCC 700848 / DSM 11109 / ASRB2) TaxID=880072 RepID=F2NDE6_DESAR|nr:pyridoxal phosphate-dependent aminotransferase [Desulfobacca acetoxidans]AEB10012.1 Aspartate transaminase [Desulfobacca acetoxidans DSM 11109]
MHHYGVSRRAQEITPFLVMDILERAQELERQGISVIHLEVGQPDWDTPQVVKEAAFAAMQRGETQYTHSMGLLELRQAICQHYAEKYGVRLTPDRVIVTSGTSPAMLLIFAALLDPGDEIILTDPHYACYPNFVRLVDAVPRYAPIRETDGFQVHQEDFARYLTARTKALLINSPANPTGTVLTRKHMEEIAGLGPYVISDEIYHGLIYEGREHSILEFTDRAFVINGFSKAYAMTGWRLGYLIAPPEFMRPLQKLMQNFFISANAFVQQAGIAALTLAGAEVEQMRQIYSQRRRFLVDGLKKLGFAIPVEPTGAFYVFVNAGHLSGDSYQLAFDILEQAHVGVTPGVDFGSNGEGFLRFSYANSLDNIGEALGRLEQYLSGRYIENTGG